MNILFTSSGRRVSLIKLFKETLMEQFPSGKILTADLKETAPTAFYSDKHFVVPSVVEENYIDEIIKICLEGDIKLVIPLIDTELGIMASNRHRFDNIGVKLLVSSYEVNKIANNKIETYKFFKQNLISSPKVYSEEEIKKGDFTFPLLVKPNNGSASKGVTKINNKEELEFFKDYIPNAIVQEFINGDEYTVDVMVDFNGKVKTIVPRKRIETRAGEVSKGVTNKDFEIINAVENVVNKLPGPVGCITLQCFKEKDGEIKFIEINPRFGGGIPLSINAGANFPLWTIEICQGISFKVMDFSWKENLTMLRFDEEIYTEKIIS
ncbi:ATP-grasp domain-containing protein [Neobacillus vireti]|uniref:ATP-grasp domain-containing protein n=1 Tax=Neobacillus vireti TaxID=220686 RepID=UPI002FFF4A6C